ncbi:fungal specific transcription factor domain-containing protein [Sarocladium implicatum]|nr:fungal specific transcription factor domain-containing protein [Sarocladium implicatum]
MPTSKRSDEGSAAAQRCHNCRVRRLVCDQTLPGCQKCASRGVECPGYGRNLRWVQPSDKTEASKPLVRRARGRPRLQLMEKEADDDEVDKTDALTRLVREDAEPGGLSRRWVEGLVPQKHSKLRVEMSLVPEDYIRSQFLLEHLNYHNNYMIKDIGVFTSSANPHNIPLQLWRDIPSYFFNVLIATGTTHQIIRSQSMDSILGSQGAMRSAQIRGGDIYLRLQSLGHPHTHRVYEHFHKAIGDVNNIIANNPDLTFRKVNGLDTGDLMIAAISGLMLSGIQQTAFGSWPAHFEALRVMIKRRGGYQALVSGSSPRLLYLLVTFLIVDVIRRPTMTSRTLSEIDDEQDQYLPTLDNLFQDGLETGSPCPTQCLRYQIKVHQLRRRWYREGNDPERLQELRDDSAAALREARAFDPISWARERKPEYENMSLRRADKRGQLKILEEAVKKGPVMDDWVNFGVVFRLAGIIYGMRTTIIEHRTPDWPDQNWLIEQGLDPLEPPESICENTYRSLMTVLRRLREKEQRGRDWPWRFAFWPLFVAGMETACSGIGVEDQPWIADSLYAIGQRQADFSTLDCADFFRTIWKSDAVAGSGQKWDDLISTIDGKTLFFT